MNRTNLRFCRTNTSIFVSYLLSFEPSRRRSSRLVGEYKRKLVVWGRHRRGAATTRFLLLRKHRISKLLLFTWSQEPGLGGTTHRPGLHANRGGLIEEIRQGNEDQERIAPRR
ncbi:hypothetical protein Zmor_016936 [Zophobas morio]|uniref:Uncharacterized protein n=1 Tax=Zophobas morio TaxID=2755281 RepID=A0AA38MC14_9CUCU|nr:hypothetical protein Zmor_016936 [Zophobas morio]